MTNVLIRSMLRRDMPEMMMIECSDFHAWTERDIINEARQRNTNVMVAEVRGHVVGHMIYELQQNKIALHRMIVHPGYRRRGVARYMVEWLTCGLAKCKRTHINLVVRETSVEAQLFFRSQGFRWNCTFLGHFEGRDGYQMSRFWNQQALPANAKVRESA